MHNCELHSNAVVPSTYATISARASNGSSREGNCLDYDYNALTAAFVINCQTPTNSVLFDGHIPTLTGLSGHAWASQLLTLRTSGYEAYSLSSLDIKDADHDDVLVSFEFSRPYRLGWVDVVLFNCPQLNISATSIEVLGVFGEQSDKTRIGFKNLSGDADFSAGSCNYLWNISVKTPSEKWFSHFHLMFGVPGRFLWVYLAEVAFYTHSDVPAGTIQPAPIKITQSIATITITRSTGMLLTLN